MLVREKGKFEIQSSKENRQIIDEEADWEKYLREILAAPLISFMEN
jgi:hypothetical protein